MESKNILVGVLILILFLAGYLYFSSDSQTQRVESSPQGAMMEMDDGEMDTDVEVDGVMVADDSMMQMDESVAAGSYEAYDQDKLALAENGTVVLYFKAEWCPTCRALDANLEENRDAIPDGVHILYLDYDTEIELRKKYGVTVQHTLVEVDAEGELVKKWTGSRTLDAVITEL